MHPKLMKIRNLQTYNLSLRDTEQLIFQLNDKLVFITTQKHFVTFAGVLNSPLLQHSLSACGSVCHSPWQSYWRFPHPSQASETAATAHKVDPYLELNKGMKCDYLCCITYLRDHLLDKTHCCFPSCRSKGLFLLHCEQTCNSQCTGTSCQLSHACKS